MSKIFSYYIIFYIIIILKGFIHFLLKYNKKVKKNIQTKDYELIKIYLDIFRALLEKVFKISLAHMQKN
jgi:hypothetical protein